MSAMLNNPCCKRSSVYFKPYDGYNTVHTVIAMTTCNMGNKLYQLFSAPRVLNHPPGHESGPYHVIAVPQSIGDVLVTCNLSGSKHLGLSDSYIQAHGDAET